MPHDAWPLWSDLWAIDFDPLVVSNALVVWTGYGLTPWPSRDNDRVVAEFGVATATELLPALTALESEFYESDAAQTINGLVEIGNAASARFRSLHPELSEEAVNALAWCYTFDWRWLTVERVPCRPGDGAGMTLEGSTSSDCSLPRATEWQ